MRSSKRHLIGSRLLMAAALIGFVLLEFLRPDLFNGFQALGVTIGLVLIGFAWWASARFLRHSERPYPVGFCLHCDQALSRDDGIVCPECGARFDTKRSDQAMIPGPVTREGGR